MPEKAKITRETLLNGDITRLLHSDRSGLRIMSDDERAELVQQTLGSLGDDNELWVFAYGSLIWNPACDFEEQRRCSLQGYQKNSVSGPLLVVAQKNSQV